MFGIHRKRDDAASVPEQVEEAVQDHDELIARADELGEQAQALSGDERADALDERGECLRKAGEDNLAIDAFEESIETSRRMGVAYRGLTTLYNRKRSEAAARGDDDNMKLYFDKLQDLMQSSKDMLRGK